MSRRAWAVASVVSAICLLSQALPQEPVGVIVEEVFPDSPEARAGIEVGDWLVAYNDRPLLSPDSLRAAEENTVGERDVTLLARRGAARMEVTLPGGWLGVLVRPEMPSEALGLYKEGKSAFADGNASEAAAKWGSAARAAEEAGNRAAAAWLYRRAGEAYQEARQWQDAHRAYMAALPLIEGSKDAAARSLVLWGLGWCGQALGDLDSAQRFYTEALAAEEEAAYEMWAAEALTNLGHVASSRGDLDAAEEYHKRSLAIRERMAPGSVDVAVGLGNLGNVAADRCDLVSARDYLSRASAILEEQDPLSRDAAAVASNLGNIHHTQGNLQEAQQHYSRALEILRELAPGSVDVARALANLGLIAFDRGDLAVAQKRLTEALALYGEELPQEQAVVLNNLGIVARARGDLATAEGYFARSLDICDRLGVRSDVVVALLANLGGLARQRGDLTGAKDYLDRALGVGQETGSSSAAVAQVLVELGGVARDRRDLEAARQHLVRALEIQDALGPGSPPVAFTLSELGVLAREEGRLNEAVELLTRAVDIVESQRREIASPETRSFLVGKHVGSYTALLHTYLALEDPVAAYAVLERVRVGSLVELLRERAADLPAGAPADLLAEQERLSQERAAAYRALGRIDRVRDSASADELRNELALCAVEQRELEERIRQEAPRYAGLQYPEPLDLKASQAALGAGTLLLAYFIGEEETYLFAVRGSGAAGEAGGGPEAAADGAEARGDGLWLFRVRVGFKELGDLVDAFSKALMREGKAVRAELATAGDEEPVLAGVARARGKQLYDLLVRPAQALVDRAERVLICPFVPVPFAALVAEDNGDRVRYFADLKPLHSIDSMTLYAELRKQGRPNGAQSASEPTILAFGDPEYTAGDAAGAEEREGDPLRARALDPLPGTRVEVEALGQLFGAQARVLTGTQATETAAKDEGGTAGILHFACHGLLDRRDPLASGLALAASSKDDGLLRAWEILHDLRVKADLVVLSACETGLGPATHEGIVGLPRAFHYAGARSVLVSLWSVSDASTAALMTAFYRELRAGASKDLALQHAIAELRKDPRWQHPFYWAPFVLVGDWR